MPTTHDIPDRLTRLDTLLADHARLWRPQPYKEAHPAWCAELPALTTALLALTDAEVATLAADDARLYDLLAPHIPLLPALASASRLEHLAGPAVQHPDRHLPWAIPGRKWAQIEAFADAVETVDAPLLEWCGGKGHLGRLLGARRQVPVATLERDPGLCAQGRDLAQRARVRQVFHTVDVLTPAAPDYLPGRHAVALHACGELHRTLLRHAVEAGVPALDLAPCCYHHAIDERYTPLSRHARLTPSRDDLRLAVTDTVTALPREVRRRDLEMAWKLAFDLLRREATGEDRYTPMNPIEKPWLRLGFEGFCRAVARREQVALPAAVDWPRLEAAGWERQRRTMRLSLLRKAFGHPLEVWLALDLAAYLLDHGYRVRVGTFCRREVTPRNILITARR